MSSLRRTLNFCIDEDGARHVEASCFDDPDSGVWCMSYNIRYSEAVEAASHKRKREPSHIVAQ